MPVFHTKTIESILEPVAQQVSRLVILHEEAEDGNAMPDLARPVQAVKLAVDNLVKVGRETINSSNDQMLKHDMPPALDRVEEAASFLLQASAMLKDDPFSAPARKKLIEGSRGILQGTSRLLLTFDESEVRKIIRVCKSVLEYLAITEVVETMEDLVTYVKNISPGMRNMTKEVDAREKELTHQVHREMLQRALEQVKQLTPILISGIKIYITTREHGGAALLDAQENRDFVISKLSKEIHEIVRVLQLTTYDEDEWDADDLTVMKKAQNAIEGKLKHATDWLYDPNGVVGGVGEKSIRQILDDALTVADHCFDPTDRETINKAVGDIQSMLDGLSELRANGMGKSPQAQTLAAAINQRLKELNTKVKNAVDRTEKAAIVKPAHTVSGKVEQAQLWLQNPQMNDSGLGEQAARLVVAEGRHVAETLGDPDRTELVRLCNDTERLTNQLGDLCRKGMGHSPQAKAVAQNLSEKLRELKDRIEHALVRKVADDFLDINTPVKQLTDAALVPLGTQGREGNFQEKAAAFQKHSNQLSDTAKLVAAAGGSSNKKTVEGINTAANQADELSPQVVRAAKIVLMNPNNQAAVEHFDLLKKQWTDNIERLRGLVDEATDTVAFMKAQEEGVLRDTERTENAMKRADPAAIVGGTSNIARRVNRVYQVAHQEAENSEDPAFVHKVGAASENLRSTIAPMVHTAKGLATNPKDPTAANHWRNANDQLIDGVRQVRKVIEGEYKPHEEFRPPPPPDIGQLSLKDTPPRPPLPQSTLPPRPPPPETDDEDEAPFPTPQANQPIMMAAHALHHEVKQWSSKDNEIIAAAKLMAKLMAKLSQLVRGEGGSKRELIATAREIASASEDVTRLAKNLARECTDKRMRTNLLQVCERIPTIGTQLKILSTVKATMLGAQGSEEDQEATEMLVGNAQNLMQSVRETVRAAEAASIKIRVDSGIRMMWNRRNPWYTS